MSIPQFSLAVVGAPYDNKDGSNRGFEIMLCSPGEAVTLIPEPKNKYDEHAVAVGSVRGVEIGFVNSERAPHIGLLLRNGHSLDAVFQERTAWGCVIRVGVDEIATLPAPRASRPVADDDYDRSGFQADYIPPDD